MKTSDLLLLIFDSNPGPLVPVAFNRWLGELKKYGMLEKQYIDTPEGRMPAWVLTDKARERIKTLDGGGTNNDRIENK